MSEWKYKNGSLRGYDSMGRYVEPRSVWAPWVVMVAALVFCGLVVWL
jgi:hypothetical protein